MKTYIVQRKRLLPGLFIFPLVLLASVNNSQAQSKPWPVPASFTNTQNPVASDPNTAKEGKKLYISYCTPCHGDKGKGDGPAAASLTPKPADHTSVAMTNETDGSIYYKITEGRNPMPQYKAALTETQRWQLVAFIRTLAKNVRK